LDSGAGLAGWTTGGFSGGRSGLAGACWRFFSVSGRVGGFWDNLAEKYAAQPVELPDAFDKKIAITRSLMTPDSVVLDIGCGTGSLALRLADAGREVHGLDVSPEMIRIARTKTAAQAADNVTFHVGPFDEGFTAFEPEGLDVVCAYSILHLLDDRDAALAHMHRLLKPGGALVSSTVCLGESWVPFSVMIGLMRLFGKAPRVVASISEATLMDEMQAAGFVDITPHDVGAKQTTAFIVARKAERFS